MNTSINQTTKFVSAIYELNYVAERNCGRYKNFPLISATIKNIIFPEYQYVIYTDENTYNIFDLKNEFPQSNIEIKFKELNTLPQCETIKRVQREEFISAGMNYDRIYCVDNYLEVILNKLQFLIDESVGCDNVFWIDAGLVGTSCHDNWRSYITPLINSKNFLDKLVEKSSTPGFLHLRGDAVGLGINYHARNRLRELHNLDRFYGVPGAFFGGKSELVKQMLTGYLNIFDRYVNEYNHLISEQDVLSVITEKNKDKCSFFEIDDWQDFQRAVLQILDIYDESRYIKDKCYEQ